MMRINDADTQNSCNYSVRRRASQLEYVPSYFTANLGLACHGTVLGLG